MPEVARHERHVMDWEDDQEDHVSLTYYPKQEIIHSVLCLFFSDSWSGWLLLLTDLWGEVYWKYFVVDKGVLSRDCHLVRSSNKRFLVWSRICLGNLLINPVIFMKNLAFYWLSQVLCKYIFSLTCGLACLQQNKLFLQIVAVTPQYRLRNKCI